MVFLDQAGFSGLRDKDTDCHVKQELYCFNRAKEWDTEEGWAECFAKGAIEERDMGDDD